MGMVKHSQILYNIPKKVRDEVDFFDVDKHQSFLTVDFNTLGIKFVYNIPKKVKDEVDFFDVDKHQSFLTVDFNTLGIKFTYNMIGMIMKT